MQGAGWEGRRLGDCFVGFVFFFSCFLLLRTDRLPLVLIALCASEQSIHSSVCPSVCVDVRGFIVLLQSEVGSRTWQRVTWRNRTRGITDWEYNKC